MTDLGARLKTGYGSAARIAEQVEHTELFVAVFYYIRSQIPVDRLLWEDARMLEAHGFHVEHKVAVADPP